MTYILYSLWWIHQRVNISNAYTSKTWINVGVCIQIYPRIFFIRLEYKKQPLAISFKLIWIIIWYTRNFEYRFIKLNISPYKKVELYSLGSYILIGNNAGMKPRVHCNWFSLDEIISISINNIFNYQLFWCSDLKVY